MANAIKAYIQQGGNIYLEGADALGIDQLGNNILLFMFGLENVNNGNYNEFDLLEGQESSIMDGMEFSASNQVDQFSIDLFEPYASAATAEIAFEENDYGAVAVQFDGTEFYGQKTFCMSYSLANLEDGVYPNTRDEILQRIVDFFNPTTSVSEKVKTFISEVQVYPNPATTNVTVTFELDMESAIDVNLYNLSGQKVINESGKTYSSGRHVIQYEIDNLPAGTYFYNLTSSTEVFSGKLIVVK